MKVHTFRIAKVIVAILVSALAVMAAPMFASAASQDTACIEIKAVDCSKDSNRFQFLFNQSIESGDVITFYIKPHKTDCNLEVRTAVGGDDYYFVNEKFGNGESVVSLGDGWYAVRAEATVSSDFWAIKVAKTTSTGDVVYIRDIKINGNPTSNSTAANSCDDWYEKPTITATPKNIPVDGNALSYDWSKHEAPVSGPYVPETFKGNLPTYDTTPYTWKINSELGGATNLPEVNLAATGRYTNVTNVNAQLEDALTSTKFVKPNNMIFIISDGFGQNYVTLAEHYTGNLILNDMPNYGQSSTASHPEAGSKAPVTSLTTTDSAAGGTALSTGFKTRYYYEALDVDGNDIPQITEVLRKQFGKIIGVVTTGWAYDATPAVYGGAHAVRGDSDEIAMEMMTFAPDLFIGEGVNDYSETFNDLKKDVLKNQDIAIYSNWATAVNATNDKVWISVPADVRYSDDFFSEKQPTISQMMAYSLTWLQAKSYANDNVGFFLMFENGMTDDAGHSDESKVGHDGKVILAIGETNATDEAAAIALKFACENPDTIVILTADHETGGLNLKNGWETSLSQCKWDGTGHSNQDVAVYAIGKNTEVFDGQIMHNAQVGKVTAYLMGLTSFGSTESKYDIDGIIAGVKNDITVDIKEPNRIQGLVLHVRADVSMTRMQANISGLNVVAHGMISVAVRVPKGATSIQFCDISGSSQTVLLSQTLDKSTNYISEHDYYYVTFKPTKTLTKLAVIVTGNFAKGDEVWVDTLQAGESTIDFDTFSSSNVSAGTSNTTVSIYKTASLPTATATPKPTATPTPKPTATPVPDETEDVTENVTTDVTTDVTIDVTQDVTTDVTEDGTEDVTTDTPTATPTPTPTPAPEATATPAPQESTSTPAAGDADKNNDGTVWIIVGAVVAAAIVAGVVVTVVAKKKK